MSPLPRWIRDAIAIQEQVEWGRKVFHRPGERLVPVGPCPESVDIRRADLGHGENGLETRCVIQDHDDGKPLDPFRLPGCDVLCLCLPVAQNDEGRAYHRMYQLDPSHHTSQEQFSPDASPTDTVVDTTSYQYDAPAARV